MNGDSKGRNGRRQALCRIRRIADCRVNDAVKLAFLDGGLDTEQMKGIDALELGALAEFRRNASGGVEIKLIDRIAALEKLAALSGEGEAERAEQFFRALEGKAGDGRTDGV